MNDGRSEALFLLLLAFICASILIIHKIGLARVLRLAGHAFIAAGDSVDHWKERVKHLNAEEREFRSRAA